MKNIKTDFKKLLHNKILLVTGGTGSFGNAFVERVLQFSPKKVVIFSRDEKKQYDMSNKFNNDDRLKFVMGDVRDRESITYAMTGVDYVFHAAALKQVPNCEFFPMEAIKTNALGAHNVIHAAADNNVKKVVVLSTDKAVHPINVMGMTKALMERIMIANSRELRTNTVFCGTRYGNVMYTRGSVLPFFVELMQRGLPLRVTNKHMTRFMLSLQNSIDLVLFALINGQQGEIYVKKAPAATVGDTAQAMAQLFSYKKGIQEIGVRPGEKMHESLISSEELSRTVDCGDYFKIIPESPTIDYRNYFFNGQKGGHGLPDEGYTSANTKQLNLNETKKLIASLPEIQAALKSFK